MCFKGHENVLRFYWKCGKRTSKGIKLSIVQKNVSKWWKRLMYQIGPRGGGISIAVKPLMHWAAGPSPTLSMYWIKPNRELNEDKRKHETGQHSCIKTMQLLIAYCSCITCFTTMSSNPNTCARYESKYQSIYQQILIIRKNYQQVFLLN